MEEIEKMRKTGKSGQKWAPTLQRREPTPWRRRTPRREIPLTRRGRGAKIAPLKGLRRSVAVHNKQIFYFCSRAPRISTPTA